VTKDLHALPRWAPRVAPERIRRLYELDAHGIYDEDLILDVGYGLLARCESFITAVAASQGRVTCPLCGATVHHGHDKAEEMRCACGWSLAWGDYFATIQHKQLSGAEPVLALFGDFVDRFPKARTPQQRMMLIDTLLHGFHIFAKTGNPTRPVAVNLIEMRLWQVIEFLDELSYDEASSPGARDRKAVWDEDIRYARSWREES